MITRVRGSVARNDLWPWHISSRLFSCDAAYFKDYIHMWHICNPWGMMCHIRKIAGCACAGNAGNVFPRRRFQKKPLVSDPGMHHGTCVAHVPWCMSGSLTCGNGENVPGIPGACAPTILRILQEAHEGLCATYHFQFNRSNVKVTRLVRIFWVRAGGILVDHRSTISSFEFPQWRFSGVHVHTQLRIYGVCAMALRLQSCRVMTSVESSVRWCPFWLTAIQALISNYNVNLGMYKLIWFGAWDCLSMLGL